MKLGAIRALRPQLERLRARTSCTSRRRSSRTTRARHSRARCALPVIETYHTYFEEYLHHYVPLMPRAVMRFVARRFTVSQCNALDALVVPSRAMRTGAARLRRALSDAHHSDRHGDGALRRRRRRSAFARSSASRRVSPTLVHVGRIAHEKNIDFLFRMFAHVVRSKPEAVLIVAGEGPALASLQGLRRLARLDAARALRRLSVARARAARLLPRRRSVRVLVARPRRRAWCCSKRWRSACRSFRRRTWARPTS